MDREFKKEWLIKALNEDGKLIDIFYNIARGYFDSKGRKIKMQNKKIDEIIIKLLEIQNRLNNK